MIRNLLLCRFAARTSLAAPTSIDLQLVDELMVAMLTVEFGAASEEQDLELACIQLLYWRKFICLLARTHARTAHLGPGASLSRMHLSCWSSSSILCDQNHKLGLCRQLGHFFALLP